MYAYIQREYEDTHFSFLAYIAAAYIYRESMRTFFFSQEQMFFFYFFLHISTTLLRTAPRDPPPPEIYITIKNK
jgi:hypothetical protein